MDERRKAIRIRCEISCDYDDAPSRAINRPETSCPAVAHDLSEGGARLMVFDFLPVGRKIRARIEIPHAPPVEALMEVRWVSEIPHCDRFEIGGQFVSLSEDQRDEIRRFLYTESIRRAA